MLIATTVVLVGIQKQVRAEMKMKLREREREKMRNSDNLEFAQAPN